MSTPTQPLVAAEVDLRDFGFMPLDVLRLRDSDLMALSTGDEFKAAVALWCVAWHQVPAASLPNDDRLLARYSGAGPAWRKVKAEALRGFVECSDGRLYHATIAEKAREAWESKLAQRARTKAATEAREAKRRAALAQRDDERDEPRDVQRDVARDVHQGTGTGTGTVKGQGQGTVLPPDGGSDPAPTRQPTKPLHPPEGIAPQVWSDWLQVRKGKRAGPVTETAWSGLVREAAKAGITAEAAVRACCEFGWQGFNAGWYAQRKPLTAGGAPAALSFAERETARKAARYAEMTGGLIGQAATPPTPGEFIDMEPTDGTARLLG